MNMLLAGIAAATRTVFPVLLVAVAISALTGAMLLWHYSQRLNHVREVERRIARHLNNTVFDITVVTAVGWRSARSRRDNDRYELFGFLLGILLSVIPILVALRAR
jgi:hypothetical protein